MSKTVFRIETTPTIRDLIGNVMAARDGLPINTRQMAQRQGARFRDLLQEEAPFGKTGKFQAGIRYKTFEHGDSVGFTASVPQPLGDWIIKGTQPHKIAARNKGALSFYWPKFGGRVVVPKGGGFATHIRGTTLWIGKGYINHPGTKPDPFPGRAFARWLPGARADLKSITSQFARTFTGGGGARKVLGP